MADAGGVAALGVAGDPGGYANERIPQLRKGINILDASCQLGRTN